MSEFFLRELFETMMVICFGIAWPISISKSLRAKTSKGKSLLFLFIILAGYSFGVTKKIVCGEIGPSLIFYSINFIMVSFDIFLWMRNHKVYDKAPIKDF